METMKKLCKRFNRLCNGYTAELDNIESYSGYYVVYITRHDFGYTSRMVFNSVSDFSEWANIVVLD